ncbi:hypothetical protein MEQU1_003645 [Malassezia equina]|uniref:Mitochondrial zinc maintenance protein 1, mitochondrial n=1 Tax=Malassezia equina TaxID=1381935 RepID=A0AAF0J1W9_9BASI|nr:hypothetical protein MEQU1_003645 [Malassezia equina]
MTTTAFSGAQRGRATSLYRSLLRTTRELFGEDVRAVQAAHAETRRRFLEAKLEQDPAKIDEGLEMGEQVDYMLKHNVVQGVPKDDADNTYKLRFTEHTELGSNDTIKQARPAPTLAEIERTKGRAPSSCADAGVRSFSTSARAAAKNPEAGSDALPLPRPVARFPSIVILADGSSVRMTTTSPRYMSKMTRDYTNHPLWNPMMGSRTDAGADDDSGRLGRFRRRFAEEGPAQAANVAFDEADFGWMSGGREARPGAPIQTKKGKGKGKK